MITYLSLHLIANETLELVYENAPECTILKWKKNQKFSGEGDFAPPQATLHPSPHCFFDKLNTVVNLCQGKFSSIFLAGLAQTPGLFLHGSVLTYTKKRFSKTDDIGADCLIYNLYSPYFILLNMKYTFLGSIWKLDISCIV